MRLTFLGVRGSTSAPGREFVRYGGHTSCVAVTLPGHDVPTLVLDAGTGLRRLSGLLGDGPFRGTVLLSHLHWDHVKGIPFCAAVDRPDARVEVWVPAQDGRSARDLVAQMMSPPAFPITPEGLRGGWSFREVEPGPVAVAVPGCAVTAFEVTHKGGRTYGYRLESDGSSVGYVPDHCVAAGVPDAALAALRGVDVLVHDAQNVVGEEGLATAYGHATVPEALELAERVGAGRLVLFHHSPTRTDKALDRIAAAVGDLVGVAAEDGVVEVGRSRGGR